MFDKIIKINGVELAGMVDANEEVWISTWSLFAYLGLEPRNATSKINLKTVVKVAGRYDKKRIRLSDLDTVLDYRFKIVQNKGMEPWDRLRGGAVWVLDAVQDDAEQDGVTDPIAQPLENVGKSEGSRGVLLPFTPVPEWVVQTLKTIELVIAGVK